MASLVAVPGEDLKAFARAYDVDDTMKRQALIKELSGLGFSWDDFVEWKNSQQPQKEEVKKTDKSEDKSEKVLVKMNRSNPVYEAYGVRWTKKAPYQLMDSEDASALLETVEGFSRVSKKDAAQYFDV